MNNNLKRSLDILLALSSILVLGPAFILIALTVRLSSPGPTFFKQKRLTKGSQEFVIYKFRTMRADFDKDGRGIQIKASSSAITPIGKFLRRTKLDELPQLFNILKGDMSFVGPRPELPRRLQYYSESDRKVFSVRSGVSSPASVILVQEEHLMETVANPETFYIEQIMPFKIALNKDYIDRMSLTLDLKVIAATALRIFGIDSEPLVLSDRQLLERKKLLESKARSTTA